MGVEEDVDEEEALRLTALLPEEVDGAVDSVGDGEREGGLGEERADS